MEIGDGQTESRPCSLLPVLTTRWVATPKSCSTNQSRPTLVVWAGGGYSGIAQFFFDEWRRRRCRCSSSCLSRDLERRGLGSDCSRGDEYRRRPDLRDDDAGEAAAYGIRRRDERVPAIYDDDDVVAPQRSSWIGRRKLNLPPVVSRMCLRKLRAKAVN
ncbi:unnamed protein product [Linum trigynum]|uniref:Uncharacterized protein n=1 Tax=Linum trigynum TaxID=586398 RepID=A0AAV2FYP9_9ROSI